MARKMWNIKEFYTFLDHWSETDIQKSKFYSFAVSYYTHFAVSVTSKTTEIQMGAPKLSFRCLGS